jgi:hypothetical protein
MSLVDHLHTAASTSQTFINLLFNSVSDPLNILTYRTMSTISIMALLVSNYTYTYALHLFMFSYDLNSRTAQLVSFHDLFLFGPFLVCFVTFGPSVKTDHLCRQLKFNL